MRALIAAGPLVCILAMAAPVAGAEGQDHTETVVTVGTSNIYRDDVSSARTQAITNSLVSAVAQVNSSLILSDTMTSEFELVSRILFSRVNEYIGNYKVLKAARGAKRYSVMVESTVLSGKMAEKLSAVGITLRKNALPSVLLFVTEQALGNAAPKYWWKDSADPQIIYAEGMMALAMQEKGITVLDHGTFPRDETMHAVRYRPSLSKQETLALGAHYQADLIVSATAAASEASNRMGDGIRSYSSTVTAHVHRTASGAEIGSTVQSFTAAGSDPHVAGADALAGAGRLAGRELAIQITAARQERLASLAGIEVFVKWGGDLAQLVELRAAIVGIPGVRQLLPRSMTAEELLMAVDYEGSERELANNLMLHTFSSFGIHIFEVSESRLSIEIVNES